MKRFHRLIASLLILFFGCTTQNKPIHQQDNFPPTFGGIKNVRAIDDDNSYDYFMVRWFKATDNATPSDKIKYKVLYKKTKGALSPFTAGVVTGETLSYIVKIERISLNTEELPTYYFQVIAYDEKENSTTSKTVAARAEDFHPPKWGHITEVNIINSEKIQIKWSPADDERTLPDHIKYNVFWGTSKINFKYMSPLTTIVGETSCYIDFDLKSYQNRTLYFTIVAEDLSGNRNYNGIFRELKTGQISTMSLGKIRVPVNHTFSMDLYQYAQGMSFRMVEVPPGTTLKGDMLYYTPVSEAAKNFTVEGYDLEGNIKIIKFELNPFTPPLSFQLPFHIKYVVPGTAETFYAFSQTGSPGGSLVSYTLEENQSITSFPYNKAASFISQPVTWSGINDTFVALLRNGGNRGKNEFVINYPGQITGGFVTDVTTFTPCPVSTYTTLFSPDQIKVDSNLLVTSADGLVEAFDYSGNKEFSLYPEKLKAGKWVLRGCSNSVRTVMNYSNPITVKATLSNGFNKLISFTISEPDYYIFDLYFDKNNLTYSYESSSDTVNFISKIKMLAASEEGTYYALTDDGSVYVQAGSMWIRLDTLSGINKLIETGNDEILAASNNSIWILNGLDDPLNILPSECSPLPENVSMLLGMRITSESLWLIFPDTAYDCSR